MRVDPLRLGLWGTYDVSNFGDALFPKVIRAELQRRLPAAEIRTFSPYGWQRADAFDEGEPAAPLLEWNDRRIAELAAAVDAVVIGGGEIMHGRDELLGAHYAASPEELRRRAPSRFFIDGLGDHEDRVPVFWNAVGAPFDFSTEPGPDGDSEADRVGRALARRRYTTVRDPFTRARVEATGARVDAVVPDPGFVLDRRWSASVLDQRLAYLRRMGWYPTEGSTLVVNGNRSLVPLVTDLAEQVAKLGEQGTHREVVLLPTSRGHGDDEFAVAFTDAYRTVTGQTPWRVPDEIWMADVVAAVRGSALYVGSSLHGAITAFTYDVPTVVLDLTGQSKLEALAELLAGAVVRVTAPDTLHDGAIEALDRPSWTAQRVALQDAVDRHFDRLADEVLTAVADRVDGGADAATSIAELLRRIGDLTTEVEGLRRAGTIRGERDRRRLDRLVDRVVAERAAGDAVVAERDARIAALDDELRATRASFAAERQASDATLASVRADRDRIEAERDELRRHLDAVFETKTMRTVALPRRLYHRLRFGPGPR